MRHVALALIAIMATPAFAEDTTRIETETEFLQTIAGKELRLGLYGITLTVHPQGKIEGIAMGQPVAGTWEWENGAFCRHMTWGKKDIGHNCQAVDMANNKVTFISDQGKGDSATFRLR